MQDIKDKDDVDSSELHGSCTDDIEEQIAASNRMVSRQIGQHQIPLSHAALAQHRGVRWCWTCGNYSVQHGAGLLKECPGRPSRAGRQVLQRLSEGKPPRADKDWPMTEAEAPPSTL